MYQLIFLEDLKVIIIAQAPLPSAEVKNGRAILPLPHMSSWHAA
jgi:hypothetical protein